jgi:hypothetical protein
MRTKNAGRDFPCLPVVLFGHDPGPGFAFEGAANVFRIGDQGLLAAVFHEPDNGLDFGSHGTFGKMYTFSQVSLGFSQGHFIKPFFLRLAEVECYLFDSRRDNEQISLDLLRQQTGSKILVDYGRGATIIAITRVNNRDAATTDRDGYDIRADLRIASYQRGRDIPF